MQFNPEHDLIGGFLPNDGTIDFYLRINSFSNQNLRFWIWGRVGLRGSRTTIVDPEVTSACFEARLNLSLRAILTRLC